MRRLGTRPALAVLPLLFACIMLLLPNAAYAVMVPDDDLFLPPSLIQKDYYDTHMLTFGSATQVTQTYTTADVGGSLLGVRILPVLNPNPAPTSTEGEYTDADLNSINVTNYSQYFFRRPTTDYSADLTPGAVSVDYRACGQYFVEISAEHDGVPFTKIYHDQVDDFFAPDPPSVPKDKAGVSRKTSMPVADVYIVSDKDPNDNGAMTNALAYLTSEGKNPKKADSIQQVIDAIEQAYKDNGNKKVEVFLAGHGRSGSIKIGTQRINNFSDGNMTPGDFQKKIDKWTHSIQFGSCNTGQDAQFRKEIVASITTVTTFTTPVTYATSYMDIDADAKKAFDTIPEPSGFMVLIIGGMGPLFIITRSSLTRRHMVRTRRLVS